MSDFYTHETTDFRIATSVLEDIVEGVLAGDERLRVHQGGMMRGGGVDVAVEGDACRITVPVAARFGEDLRALGNEVRESVAEAMRSMTGLQVESVDVVISRVYPAESEE